MKQTNHKSNTVSQALAVLDAMGVSYQYSEEFDMYYDITYRGYRYALFNTEEEGILSLGLDVGGKPEYIEQYREMYEYADEHMKETFGNAGVKIANNHVFVNVIHNVPTPLTEKDWWLATHYTYSMWPEFYEACECGGSLYIPED